MHWEHVYVWNMNINVAKVNGNTALTAILNKTKTKLNPLFFGLIKILFNVFFFNLQTDISSTYLSRNILIIYLVQ